MRLLIRFIHWYGSRVRLVLVHIVYLGLGISKLLGSLFGVHFLATHPKKSTWIECEENNKERMY